MDGIISTRDLVFMDKISYPDIDIKDGSVTFVHGPSGAGKSTLLKIFNGTVTPKTGEVFFMGENIGTMDKILLRRNIILAEQVPYLFQDTILGNFVEFHKYHESKCPDKEEIKKYLDICFGDFDLSADCNKLSGGERQRVFLAIALSLKAKVLLLDEPTSALNTDLAFKVVGKIIDYCKSSGITLVVVSHDESLKDRFGESVVEVGE